jgi:hypothetical protein
MGYQASAKSLRKKLFNSSYEIKKQAVILEAPGPGLVPGKLLVKRQSGSRGKYRFGLYTCWPIRFPGTSPGL